MWQFPLTIRGEPVSSIVELLGVMRRQLRQWDAARDNRAAFLRVYAAMTAGVEERRSQGFFLDPAWIERVAVRFGWYYFHALGEWEAARRAPPAWTYAFEQAKRRRTFVLQDILLGMNAHINNDLPLVVWELLVGEGDAADRERSIRRRFDHDQINRVLELVIPGVEREVASHYGRGIRPLSWVLGDLDEALTLFGLITYRDKVWQNAQFLLAATEAERATVIHWIEQDALHVAELIARFGPLRAFRPLASLTRRLRLF
ncbi:MAG TPA: DUF5995 family protein [Symbiobacteriaceae bacterium]|nr:DUF5995 family protein [Symbiobacteriaceae bacterium]